MNRLHALKTKALQNFGYKYVKQASLAIIAGIAGKPFNLTTVTMVINLT
ncbi:hypothetical protein Xhom_00361 [Xenorhabdus hominickii]|uniref:Uncharacterized protein n=1 Tax=Xenorhabdus hominickii TaxID=351679 RepID=A0A2G0QDT4_XENHO|nr:hypothetical protein Xhom_00361 [Xenorhabdus hominickii]